MAQSSDRSCSYATPAEDFVQSIQTKFSFVEADAKVTLPKKDFGPFRRAHLTPVCERVMNCITRPAVLHLWIDPADIVFRDLPRADRPDWLPRLDLNKIFELKVHIVAFRLGWKDLHEELDRYRSEGTTLSLALSRWLICTVESRIQAEHD